MMDTEFGIEALKDRVLYDTIVEHRRLYYNLKYVDYDKHAPQQIDFVPPEHELERWRKDYDEMQRHFILGEALPFDDLILRIKELRKRFSRIS